MTDTLPKTQTPAFWRNSPRTTAVQVHTAADAKLVIKHLEGRRIAFSCHGPRLEVFEVNKSLDFGSGFVLAVLPGAERVWGCDLDDAA